MKNEQLYEMLESLGITGREDSYEVSNMVRDHGFKKDFVTVHGGASKVCLDFAHENFVIKWTGETRGDYDEAMEEVEIYQKAVNAGLAVFFPATELFATINGVHFVKQEKVDFCVGETPYHKEKKYAYQSRTASDRIVKKMQISINRACGHRYSRSLNTTWAKMALVVFGKKLVKSLCEFIIENGINDLHESNIGYKDNLPVILDFSGYKR